MNNAKQLAYALVDALNACGIEEEFSYRFLAEMNDILRKENKKMEMNNEAKALAGHDKELQNGIILLMKEYGLSGGEAYELINRLSNAGNIKALMDDECDEVKSYRKFTAKPQYKVFANLTDEQKEEINKIESPVEILAKAVAKESTKIEYADLISLLEYAVSFTLEDNDMRKAEEQIKEIIKEHELISGFCEYLIKKNMTLDDAYKAIDEYSDKQKDEEPGDIADVMQDVYTSGEDPGDTHEPSKGSGTPNYERILEKLGWFLDCNENLSHYSLYNEIKDILKEHQEQNKPVEYGTPKDIGNGEYIAPMKGERIVPLTPKMYADGQAPKPEIDTTHEGRAYQEMQFKDFVITFLEGDKCIKSTDIHEALQYAYLLCEGYMAHIDKRRYRMKEILLKQYPSHEVIVKVEEVKAYQ